MREKKMIDKMIEETVKHDTTRKEIEEFLKAIPMKHNDKEEWQVRRLEGNETNRDQKNAEEQELTELRPWSKQERRIEEILKGLRRET